MYPVPFFLVRWFRWEKIQASVVYKKSTNIGKESYYILIVVYQAKRNQE